MAENNIFNKIVRKCTNLRDCYNTQFDECSRLKDENKKLRKINEGLEKNLTICSNVSFDRICKLTKRLQKNSDEINTLKNELADKDELTKRMVIETAKNCQAQIKRIIEENDDIVNAQQIANTSESESDVEHSTTSSNQKKIDSLVSSSIEIDSSTRSSSEIDSSTKSSSEIDSSSAKSSACEVDGSSDSSMENNTCFENECETHEATNDLLRSIEECCCSNESLDPKPLLEKCKTVICNIMNSIKSHNDEFKRYKLDSEFYRRKLQEEQKISTDKRSENCAIKTENVLLTNELEQTKKLRTDDQLKEELKNVKYCLEMRTEENKSLENDNCQMKQRLENSDKVNGQLECDIRLMVRKLENCLAFKKESNKKYNDLTGNYNELQNDLVTEKQENVKMSKKIDDFCRETHCLKSVITGLKNDLLLNAEKDEKLKAEIRALENKCNEMKAVEKTLHYDIDTLKREMKDKNLEVDSRNVHIDTLNEHCRKQCDRIKSLECDVEKLEKQLRCDEAKIERLEVNNRKYEIDLKEASDHYEELMGEKNRIVCENEQIEKNIIKLCKHTQLLQYKQADLEGKNDELVIAHCSLEEDNRKLAENIDELNEELRCTRGNEIETEKTLLASEKNLSVACKEIDNLKLAIKCYEKTVQKEREKLRCVEQQVRDTEMRQLNNACMAYGQTLECSKCEETENAVFQLSSKHEELLLENERLTMANTLLCDKTKFLNENVETLQCTNEQLIGKIEAYEGTRCCQSDIGLQTDPWVECPSTNVVYDYHEPCDDHGNGDKTENFDCIANSSSESPEVCDSRLLSATAVETATKCDCGDRTADNELLLETNRLLRCELEEMKRLCGENEMISEQKRIEMEWKMMLSRNELESQTKAKMTKMNAKLEMYVATMQRLEKDLKDSQAREDILKKDAKNLTKTILHKENKDNFLEKEVKKNKISSKIMDDAKEKSNLNGESKPDDKNADGKVEMKKVSEQTMIVARMMTDATPVGFSSKKIWKNEKKLNGGEVPRKKANRKKEKEKHRKPLTYGHRIDLPCCIGSKNPCDRQKKWTEKWPKNSDIQQNTPILAVLPSARKPCRRPTIVNTRPTVLPKCEFSRKTIALLREELNEKCGLPVSTVRY